jgi:hypothetical protein
MSDHSLSVRHRSAPPAERPRGVWLAPIKGVFYSPFERWANPFEEDSFECDVEPGIKWRSTTEEDRALLTDWFDFFKDAHPKNERERMTWAATVLRSMDPAFLDALTEGPSRVIAFIIALSLRTRAPLSARRCCIGRPGSRRRGWRDETAPIPSSLPSPALRVHWLSVPARGHHPGRPLVPAVRPVLPGHRGTPVGTRHRGRPREHLPVGPAVRAGVRRGRSGPSARHRGSLASR